MGRAARNRIRGAIAGGLLGIGVGWGTFELSQQNIPTPAEQRQAKADAIAACAHVLGQSAQQAAVFPPECYPIRRDISYTVETVEQYIVEEGSQIRRSQTTYHLPARADVQAIPLGELADYGTSSTRARWAVTGVFALFGSTIGISAVELDSSYRSSRQPGTHNTSLPTAP